MKHHALHLVTTGRQELEELLEVVRQLPPDVVDVFHIREKSRSARELLNWYVSLQDALPRTAIYMNDRLDVAAAVWAPGVQLGYASLPPELARTVLPDGTRIGCSVHSVAEAEDAAAHGADYVLFGHVFETGSKAGLPGRGLEALRAVVEAAPIPVIAIGGITPDNASDVLAAGCAGIAVMSGILLHEQPAEQTRRFRQALDEYPVQPKLSF